ncbi:hypothetical protein ACFE04_023991 [Oxalis oulophora]
MTYNTRNHLPQDVVIDILLSLPVKYLDRFICVCKSFYYINGHCNGLFCLSEWNKAALWNPANTQIKLLPEFPREYKHSDHRYHGLRLGWDQRTNDYKVLIFLYEEVYERRYNRHYPQYVYIYSLNNDSWRRLKGNVPQDCVDPTSDLCLNGVFYWFYNDDRLLSFHISDEVFEEIIAPNCLTSHKYDSALDKYNDHVAIIISDILCTVKSTINVWVLISENCWSKVVNIIMPFINFVCPLGIWENGEVILDGKKCIHIYDPRTQQLNYQVVRTDGYYLIKRSYKESLVSVKKMPQDFSDVFNIAYLFM